MFANKQVPVFTFFEFSERERPINESIPILVTDQSSDDRYDATDTIFSQVEVRRASCCAVSGSHLTSRAELSRPILSPSPLFSMSSSSFRAQITLSERVGRRGSEQGSKLINLVTAAAGHSVQYPQLDCFVAARREQTQCRRSIDHPPLNSESIVASSY